VISQVILIGQLSLEFSFGHRSLDIFATRGARLHYENGKCGRCYKRAVGSSKLPGSVLGL
jgi:hypothetical protein